MRLRKDTYLNITLLEDLTKMLHDINLCAHSFNALREWIVNAAYPMSYKMVIHVDRRPSREHQRNYSSPEASEVTESIPGDEDTIIQKRENIILQLREVGNAKGNMVCDELNNAAHRSNDLSSNHLLFPYGYDGWNRYRVRKRAHALQRSFRGTRGLSEIQSSIQCSMQIVLFSSLTTIIFSNVKQTTYSSYDETKSN